MLLDVPLKHALPDVDGAHQMAGLKLVAFTHVNDHQRFTVLHHRPKVTGFAFTDVAACSLNDGEEPRAPVSVILGHDFRRWVSLLRASHQPNSMAAQITGSRPSWRRSIEAASPSTGCSWTAPTTRPNFAPCAKAAGIPLEEGSANDLWRMSADGAQVALALTGRPQSETLEDVMAAGGCVWLFDGVEYSTNLGFAIRTAEVSGADAVLLNVSKTHEERRTIRRASMRARPLHSRGLHECLAPHR